MPEPLPVFPDGFPAEVIEARLSDSGRGVLCNRPYNGIDAIEHFGAEHVQSGALILYTSQDSVLQIAAHVDVLRDGGALRASARRPRGAHRPACRRAGDRPSVHWLAGSFERTEGRRDFAISPPTRSYLEALGVAGIPVHSVGKVAQLFAGVGIDAQHPGATNAQALSSTTELLRSLDRGLVFTNLVETDQVYGHRHDVAGFHRALREIDACVSDWLALLLTATC